MVGFAMSHGADDADFIGDLGGFFQGFGKINAFEFGFGRAQWAAIFDRGQQFGIERFLGGNAAGEEDIDDRFGARFQAGGLGPEFKKVAERQAHTADQTDKEEFPAIGTPDVLATVAKRRQKQ